MERFLQGMRAMDDHFRSAPLQDNLPALLGLLNVRHLPWRWAAWGGGSSPASGTASKEWLVEAAGVAALSPAAPDLLDPAA